MYTFKAGQIFDVKRWTDYSEQTYGTCEIVAVDMKAPEDLEWKSTSVKNCYTADAGTVTFTLNTATNNAKPKKATLICSRNSDEWAKEYGTPKEYQWFSPTKRNYRPIDSFDEINLAE